jgi:hypothetical protein
MTPGSATLARTEYAMRTRTLLFTTLLRALFVCIFLLLVLLDVSRSIWIDLAGLAVTGALLLAVIALALRGRSATGGRTS